MIITQTPFRMSFFGGGTDFPGFYKEHGGAVISTTFDKYCYVNVRHLPRFFDYSTELSYSRIERVTDVEAIEHPAIREAMKYLDMQEIRLTYEADLPARSGLGTSSSFAVGMLNAFYALKGKYADKRKLADDAIYLERVLCKESDKERQLLEMLSLVDEAEKVLTTKTDLNEFGRLLDYTWKLKRGISSGISTDSIDGLYAKGIEAGALGGKLLGAGGGGFLLFYVEEDKREAVAKAMEDLLYVPFQFENSGTRVIHYTAEMYEKR